MKSELNDWGWGVLVNFTRNIKILKNKSDKSPLYNHYTVDVMLKVTKNPYKTKNPEEPEHLLSGKGKMQVL